MLTLKKKVDDPGLKSAHLTETTLHPVFLGQRQHLKVKQGLLRKLFLRKLKPTLIPNVPVSMTSITFLVLVTLVTANFGPVIL